MSVQQYSYERIAAEAAAGMECHYCWPVEWFQEELPNENKDSSSLDKAVEELINKSSLSSKLLENYVKPSQQQDPIEMPPPPLPAKESVLVFPDCLGYCKGIIEAAPEGRILTKKFTDDCRVLTQEDVRAAIGQKSWDTIVFGGGLDPPQSNSVPDIIEQDTISARLYFWIMKEVQRNEGCCKKIAVLTRGIFTEDVETHKKAGLGITLGATLFGMSNSARQELELPIQFIDTEHSVKKAANLYTRIASEIFRNQTFGMNAVRILSRGRFVQRQLSSKEYEAANKDFAMPEEGVIAISGGNGALGLVMGNWLLDKAEQQGVSGFSIQFLSRSMKISDLNMPNWKAIQAKAARLGISVEQAKLDMSSEETTDRFLAEISPNLVGFIHSAGVLQDSMLVNLTWEKFETVFDSKHRAALHLHGGLERYKNPQLRFLWLFSSTSVYGNMGQINYSGSNAFLDALSRHRVAKNRPSTAIQWGAWGDVGMAATMDDASRRRMAGSPMPYFSNAEGLRGLECGLKTGLPYFSVYKCNPPIFLGMCQSCDHPNAAFVQNFYSEMAPSPMAPSLDRQYVYNVFRVARGSYKDLDVGRLVYESYTIPAIEQDEKDWGDDFRRW